jgi:Cu(I)/Ag(I) efflux system membrane fusion protein
MTDEQQDGPPPGVHAMAVVRWLLVAATAVAAVLSVAYSAGVMKPGGASAEGSVYYCPMHPQVVQDQPGECPICSMSLVLKKGSSDQAKTTDEEPAASHEGHRHNPEDPYHCPMHPEETGTSTNDRCPLCKMKLEPKPKPQAGASPASAPKPSTIPSHVPGLVPVQLSMDRVQLIGIRTAKATREPLVSELQAAAVVAADEAKFARVHARFSGWVEQLAVTTTGQKVRRGQVMANIYNLELLPAQQEFLAARKWNAGASAPSTESSAQSAIGSLADDARKRLELLGMSKQEIDRIAETGTPTRTVAITAPISGYIVRKDVAQGTYVQPGTPLFEIADLSTVWVLADVYERDIGRVSVGQAARVRVEAYPEQPFVGQVGFIFPAVDPNTRTLRVRVVLDNKELKLRPGMYGNVTLEVGKADGVVVPVEALVDTGDYQYVFLAKEGGRFEPRRVRAGARANGKIQIVQGVQEGDLVVTTANFLIDSESRLRAAIEGTPNH